MSRFVVSASTGSYPVFVQSDVPGIKEIPEHLFANDGRIILITDERVAGFHGATIEKHLVGLGFHPVVLTVPAGERAKKPNTVIRLCREMLQHGAQRGTPVCGFGGGVVGDIAGFVASIYMRGVPLLHIPTTLLAQVDSSVGGKTGVDLPEGKNLIGTFWAPSFVWSCTSFLSSLPARRVREGLSEALKYGYIARPDLLDRCLQIPPRSPNEDPDRLSNFVFDCISVKADVVTKDEHEKGLREILNFGHTIGHGIERIMGYRKITHGEAVAIGMVAELALGEVLGVSPKGIAQDARERLSRIGLPTMIPSGIDAQTLVEAVSHDKKNVGKKRTIITISTPGTPERIQLTDRELLKNLNLAQCAVINR